MRRRNPPASEFMRRELVSVHESDTVWDLARLFAERQISGVPVLNAKDELVGVVSQSDIVRHLEQVAASFSKGAFYADAERDGAEPGLRAVTAGELMTKEVIHAPRRTRASELAQMMLLRRVHRIIITDGLKPCGIVTTLDLIKVL